MDFLKSRYESLVFFRPNFGGKTIYEADTLHSYRKKVALEKPKQKNKPNQAYEKKKKPDFYSPEGMLVLQLLCFTEVTQKAAAYCTRAYKVCKIVITHVLGYK